ncbi:hypothetical protein chiPu_0007290 [Chiloscyllium punctatum]|uniref:Uncharacterized protein n=1 Tax=Chiloscyllium punctatum TaxID=137246 RepID=A0A401SEL6_CHIPU|nr:hypothetical protein [Chiloscyllium punctatum]
MPVGLLISSKSELLRGSENPPLLRQRFSVVASVQSCKAASNIRRLDSVAVPLHIHCVIRNKGDPKLQEINAYILWMQITP